MEDVLKDIVATVVPMTWMNVLHRIWIDVIRMQVVWMYLAHTSAGAMICSTAMALRAKVISYN
jgi:hypothetical protein